MKTLSYSKSLEDKFLRRTKGIKIKPSSKSELIFNLKPKIPKSGKSLYGGFYLRKLKGAVLIYDIETEMLIRPSLDIESSKEWIDKNYDEIMRRINEATGS